MFNLYLEASNYDDAKKALEEGLNDLEKMKGLKDIRMIHKEGKNLNEGRYVDERRTEELR